MQLRVRCLLMATKQMLANTSINLHQTRFEAFGWGISHRMDSDMVLHQRVFNLPADGIVDDFKQIICQELSHPRFYLAKRGFSTQAEWKPSAVLYQAQHHRQYDTFDL